MSANTKTILILGGSYGGVAIAHYILKHVIPSLPNKDDYRVGLVSSSSHFFCRPTCPRVLPSENALPKDKLFVPLTKAFEQYTNPAVTLYHGTVVKLDHSACTASILSFPDTVETNIGYYALTVATGATAASPLLGLFGDHHETEKAWTSFRKLLHREKSVEEVTSIETGYELAGTYASDQTLERVADAVTIRLDNGQTLHADLYIPAIGVLPNTNFLDRDLLDKDGYVKVDSSSLRVENAGPRVYALGHVCSSKPQAIHAIMGQAPVIGENLKQDLLAADRGDVADKIIYRAYKPDARVSQLVVIGKKGVGLAFGWKISSFLVWLIKGRDYWLGMTPPMWNGKQFAKPI
ncbi:hypothetical protein UA08_03343 [Talaromyces atroroseus]|uniref:FAD/NAD(P)-binding domain-containing protein n=1 Tax=Talaromyces atroroseus TaxID=1441469 RepID=A0A225B567_TALAT|nr:hypothetical protein UA08_03343 [Talaromyces atroroseus]OKL61067.1 hypothetical protein UA08_03343 [Talaromyces atroroseus]